VLTLPLSSGFSANRIELAVLSMLVLAILTTAQLAFANPLTPAPVSLKSFKPRNKKNWPPGQD